MKPERKILFINVSKISELKYFIAAIDFKEKHDRNVISDYNWQKIRTRNLLEQYDYILAAPVERRIQQIHIIIPEEYTFKKNFIHFMNETKLTFTGPYALNNDVYLDCIVYTLKHKMSPEWNQLSKYFVKTQNFFTANEAIEAVENHFIISDSYLALSTRALRLKLPFMTLIDLEVDIRELYKEGFSIIRKKVYILPDIKLATAIGVHVNVPSCCPFRDYSEIRDHWKTVYGLIIPKEEMIFIEVTFGWENLTYIYPLACVCLCTPIQLRSKNEFLTISEFVDTVKIKLPKICDQPLQINMMPEKIFYPISKLYLASEVIGNPNLLKVVSDNKVFQDFYNQKNEPSGPNISQKVLKPRSRSPPLFFPAFAKRTSPLHENTSKDKIFKCTPIFKPFKKIDFYLNQKDSTRFKNLASKSVHSASKNLQNHTQTEFLMTTPSKKFTSYEEVKNLARSRNLKKLTVPDIINFCRENSIPRKPKEKKESLIQKIYDFFTSTGVYV